MINRLSNLQSPRFGHGSAGDWIGTSTEKAHVVTDPHILQQVAAPIVRSVTPAGVVAQYKLAQVRQSHQDGLATLTAIPGVSRQDLQLRRAALQAFQAGQYSTFNQALNALIAQNLI
jgi:hypothetical protein